MRMTNEQFQAEVFRRSARHLQQQKQRRRRFAAGALSFAGCLVLAVSFAALLLRPEKQDSFDLTNGMSMKPEKMEDSMEYAAEAEEYEDTADMENGAADFDEVETNKTDLQTNADLAIATEGEAEFYFQEMTEQELFAYYGIPVLPKQLASLSYGGSCGNTTKQGDAPLGILWYDENADRLASDTNFFFYCGMDGDISLHITIFTESLENSKPNALQSDTEQVEMTVNGRLVILKSEKLSPEELEDMALELYAYLTD